MTEGPFVVMTVECPHCKQKQSIHVNARTRIAQYSPQTIPCINCDGDFNVTVSDKIVGGPFPV